MSPTSPTSIAKARRTPAVIGRMAAIAAEIGVDAEAVLVAADGAVAVDVMVAAVVDATAAGTGAADGTNFFSADHAGLADFCEWRAAAWVAALFFRFQSSKTATANGPLKPVAREEFSFR
jgi:hypothetical protein